MRAQGQHGVVSAAALLPQPHSQTSTSADPTGCGLTLTRQRAQQGGHGSIPTAFKTPPNPIFQTRQPIVSLTGEAAQQGGHGPRLHAVKHKLLLLVRQAQHGLGAQLKAAAERMGAKTEKAGQKTNSCSLSVRRSTALVPAGGRSK